MGLGFMGLGLGLGLAAQGKALTRGRLTAAVGDARFVTRHSGGSVTWLGRHDFDDVAGDLLSVGKHCRVRVRRTHLGQR